jgi:hypothetical protein
MVTTQARWPGFETRHPDGKPAPAPRQSTRRSGRFADRRKRGLALLIEMVAALTILMLAFVALMKLLQTSAGDGGRAGEDAMFAGFADGMLEGLRAASLQAAVTTNWPAFWNRLRAGTVSIPFPAPDMWANPADLAVRAGVLTNAVFRIRHQRAEANTLYQDHAVWYRLDVEPATLIGLLDPVVKVTLKMGLSSNAVAGTRPVRVYSEYWNPGGL